MNLIRGGVVQLVRVVLFAAGPSAASEQNATVSNFLSNVAQNKWTLVPGEYGAASDDVPMNAKVGLGE